MRRHHVPDGLRDPVGAVEVDGVVPIHVQGGVLHLPLGVVGVEGHNAVGIALFPELACVVVVALGVGVVGVHGLE